MARRVYERKFDWDEAAQLRASGVPVVEIAARLGVSPGAVYLAGDQRQRQRRVEYARRWRRAACSVCGGPAQKMHFHGDAPRCKRCAGLARATSVSEHALQCVTCREWKPDADFPHNRAKSQARRDRHAQCKRCNNEAKKRYRERNRQPCSHGCGTLVEATNRHDNTKPLECRPCSLRRIHAERRAKAAA